jgi:hypothetical protein
MIFGPRAPPSAPRNLAGATAAEAIRTVVNGGTVAALQNGRPPKAPLEQRSIISAASGRRINDHPFDAFDFDFRIHVAFLGRIPAMHLGQYLDGTDFIRRFDV